jgi:serralysin
VSFADHTYAVRGEPGGNEVLVGDHGSGCAHDAKANAVSCRGPIDSIRTSLGGGDDALTLDLGVQPSVPASIDGGPGSDSLAGGEGDDTIYGGDDQLPDSLEGGEGDDSLYGMGDFDGCDGGAATNQLANCEYPNWGPR